MLEEKLNDADEYMYGSDPLAESCYDSGIASPLYTWCLHCEQVYPTKLWRKRNGKGAERVRIAENGKKLKVYPGSK